MIRLGKKEEVEEYFEHSALSQSYLKRLCKGIAHIKEDEKTLYYKEKGHLVIGSAVDDRISMGTKQFNQDYYVASSNKPSDTIMSMVQMVFDTLLQNLNEVPNSTLHEYSDLVLDAAEHHKYQSRWKEETRVNKVMELGVEYFEELKEAHGKQILSPIQAMITGNIEMSWRTHKYTKDYFNESDKTIFFQVPIYFEYRNVDCKVLLDMVIYDPQANTIQPIDFKTMAGNTTEFIGSALTFGYNFQGAFYTEGLIQLSTFSDKPNEVETIPELKALVNVDTVILPFKFMVETTGFNVNKLTEEVNYFQGSPLMYTLSQEQMDIGKFGRPEIFYVTSSRAKERKELKIPVYPLKTRAILGYNDAIDLAIWHSFNGFEADKKVVEAEGDLLI